MPCIVTSQLRHHVPYAARTVLTIKPESMKERRAHAFFSGTLGGTLMDVSRQQRVVLHLCILGLWAAWCITRLLFKPPLKRMVLSFSFLYGGSSITVPSGLVRGYALFIVASTHLAGTLPLASQRDSLPLDGQHMMDSTCESFLLSGHECLKRNAHLPD